VPGAGAYHFGILASRLHNAWLGAVGGRLRSDYRYSKGIVYNNFPWCSPSEARRRRITAAAEAVLAARAAQHGSPLSRLYDPLKMPPALAGAHRRLDRAVEAAYGLWGEPLSDEALAACLMELHRRLAG
jgi:hypothetical protein